MYSEAFIRPNIIRISLLNEVNCCIFALLFVKVCYYNNIIAENMCTVETCYQEHSYSEFLHIYDYGNGYGYGSLSNLGRSLAKGYYSRHPVLL